jgi:hypothetical protein
MLAWLTGAQLVRKSGAVITASTTAGGARPVTTDQISFTGMRREVNRSMVQTLVTATTLPAGPWNRARPQRDAGFCHTRSAPSPSASRPTRSKPRGKSITPQSVRNT